ncbi:MAG TPA: hypothetical protein VFA59_24975, partial [Vicinamibacterales bacterium]|nr:hypothetical protein [Vicinamibacterales bacterium]
YSVIALLGSLYLVRHIGIVGVPIGYGISAVAACGVSLVWFLGNTDEDTARTCVIVAAGLAVSAIQAWLAWTDRLQILQGVIVAGTATAAALSLWRASVGPSTKATTVP